jgi:hypothetical protein
VTALLAVDLGLRTGLAVFGDDGRLLRYRSQNFGTVGRLKRAAWGEIASVEGLAGLVVEGDTGLARVWARVAERSDARVFVIQAGRWRKALLTPKERRSGPLAKASAGVLARRIVAASGLPRPKALRHDAAEAICIGWWGVGEMGWDRPALP